MLASQRFKAKNELLIDLFASNSLTVMILQIRCPKLHTGIGRARLGSQEKEEIKKMLLEQKPTDYSLDRQIWTGKIIIEVIQARWGIEIKDSRIYDILKEMRLSHQTAHRDYENSDPQVQKEFVVTVKKNCGSLRSGSPTMEERQDSKNWGLESG